jgi:GNAT superfamily N-acetyltransferase
VENPWVLRASEDWFGFNSESILSRIGLVHKLDLMGMLAERLSPPTRRLPDVQLRWISDEESRFALADLNADAYGVPRDWGRQALGSAALWRGPLFGRIAYIGGEPVAGAFALRIDSALYVGWVATSKSYRRMGFAELVIRASLEGARKATGLERAILHATSEGQPVYTRMGYRSVVKFPFYGHEEGNRA